MKKKIISILILTFAVSLCLGLTACGNERMDEYRKKQGYNVTVTLDAVDGKFEDTNESVRTVLVKQDSKLPPPGYKDYLQNGIPNCTLYKHEIVGWYYGTKDETTGEVTYGEEFTFIKDEITQDITLYAKWQPLYGYSVIVVKTNEDGQEVEEEAGFYRVDKTKLQSFSALSPTAPKWEEHTFMEYLAQKDGEPFDMTASFPADATEVKVYTKFIEGEYIIVRTADDFIENMSATSVSSNFYLMNSIDLAGKTWFGAEIFSGRIQGNGFTIKNLNYNFYSDKSNVSNIGLFGQLGIAGRAAELIDVTFENVTLNIELKNNLRVDCNVGLLCGKVVGLNMEKVNFVDCSITVTDGSLSKLMARGLSVEAPYYYGFVEGNSNTSEEVKGIIAHPQEWDNQSSEEIQ